MKDPRAVCVLDGDDTLWMTEWQYSQAYANFFAYMYEILGDRTPSLQLLRDRFFEIESSLYDTWGVRRGRVAEAMVLTYRSVCDWVSWRFGDELRSEAHERRIREIGDMPFDFKKLRFLPEVQDTLMQLRNAEVRLCLLTSYDNSVFIDKANFLNVRSLFSESNILVVEGKKKTEDFIAVSGWHQDNDRQKRKWYAVGNGESDIRPALELGDEWHGIYIPHHSTSAYFKHDGRASGFTPPPIDHERVTTIRHFREILNVIKSPL